MKTMRILVAAASVMAAALAWADAANVLVTFSTKGPDRYADGRVVLDGERYALVWTAGEAFGGFAADGSALAPEDKVLCVLPRARGGRCPTTVFQVDSDVAPKGGSYFVYMLDTRVTADRLSPTVVISGSAEAMSFAPASALGNVAAVRSDRTVDGTGAAVPVVTDANGLADPGRLASPKIAAIRVEGAHVVITVDNLRPGLRYSVRGGLDRSVQLTAPAFEPGETVDFVVPKSDASFFSISAE